MKTETKLNDADRGGALESENSAAVAGAHAPRQMTFGETTILTIKVLAAFGVLGAALWAIDLLRAVR